MQSRWTLRLSRKSVLANREPRWLRQALGHGGIWSHVVSTSRVRQPDKSRHCMGPESNAPGAAQPRQGETRGTRSRAVGSCRNRRPRCRTTLTPHRSVHPSAANNLRSRHPAGEPRRPARLPGPPFPQGRREVAPLRPIATLPANRQSPPSDRGAQNLLPWGQFLFPSGAHPFSQALASGLWRSQAVPDPSSEPLGALLGCPHRDRGRQASRPLDRCPRQVAAVRRLVPLPKRLVAVAARALPDWELDSRRQEVYACRPLGPLPKHHERVRKDSR
jgi:hypothetical protein